MPTKIDQWSLSESRIKTLLCQKLITHTEVAELFEIMHKYNAVPKLIPEELSEWCNSKSIELRNKSRSLDKALGITKDVRVTDNLAMSMVVNDIWAQIFKEESQVKAFQIVAKKYANGFGSSSFGPTGLKVLNSIKPLSSTVTEDN